MNVHPLKSASKRWRIVAWLLAYAILQPGFTNACDGVGEDVMPGIMPFMVPEPELEFGSNGSSNSNPNGTSWSSFPSMQRAGFVVRGTATALGQSIRHITRSENQYSSGTAKDSGIAIEGDLDVYLDLATMVQNEVQAYLWFPQYFEIGAAAAFLSAGGSPMVHVGTVMERHYRVDYRQVAALLMRYPFLESLDFAFVDGAGRVVCMTFSMVSQALRVQIRQFD